LFLKFLESIDGIEEGLHDEMLIPSIEDEKAVSNSILEANKADQVIDNIGKYEYASKRHALLTVLWHTSCRMRAEHSLDVSDFYAEEQALSIRHRPDTESNLNNKRSSEYICALSDGIWEVLQDYIDVTCEEVTDNHGRAPLFCCRKNWGDDHAEAFEILQRPLGGM